MFTLIKGASVFAPEPLGEKDVLIAGGKIAAIADSLEAPSAGETVVIEAEGQLLIPGLIDSHVHIIGGGGEGGYHTRTPELKLSDAVKAGITTVVGVIGTDGATRTMPELIAKARALETEGISCYCHVGNYHVPVRTITGKIEDDMMLIDRIIGVGEVAISDHRSSQPTTDELAKVASQARIGGMLSGKAGIVNVHIGGGESRLDPLLAVVDSTDLPITSFCPTHVNRTEKLFQAGLAFAERGGVIDFTTSTIPQFLDDGEVNAPKALRRALEAGTDDRKITMTSDGQGSLPEFNAAGELTGLTVADVGSLQRALTEAIVTEGVAPEQAIRTVTENPASVLKLQDKGRVEVGRDADMLLMNEDWEPETVLARGRIMMRERKVLVKGTFE
ncbi:beta-aspartyl-peptidase [Bacillus daqingensis]|uniref:Isoaspartyl dipeptidase n=1 Tax=Bacillus daqingensis TaxID=872396 RepID=A0ABV9NX34_9BACI